MRKIMPLVIILATISVILFFSRGGEDDWICQNGQWVKHGNPSKPMPTTLCEGQEEVREIELYLPAAGDKTVGTKFVIYGKGRAFENTINYRISDDGGPDLPEANRGSSITSDRDKQLYLGSFITNAPDAGIFGYFNQEVDLTKLLKTVPPVIRLDVLELSAKDGSDIHKTSFRLNVDQSATAVFAYFSNDNLDPEISCNKTFAVARLVPKTQSLLKVAIEELLKGPTPFEKELGFGTLINSGVTINSVKISGDTATIDFSPKLEEKIGGSCWVAAIRNQITNTARQFANIKNVIISINGESKLILQP